jgi:hypothetical protein
MPPFRMTRGDAEAVLAYLKSLYPLKLGVVMVNQSSVSRGKLC